MTDIMNAEQNINAQQQPPKATVAQLLKDLGSFPQDAHVFACIEGIGLTIAFTGAYVFNTEELGDVVVLQVNKEGILNALSHEMQMMQKETEGAENH
jgi:hypothetical protein